MDEAHTSLTMFLDRFSKTTPCKFKNNEILKFIISIDPDIKKMW